MPRKNYRNKKLHKEQVRNEENKTARLVKRLNKAYVLNNLNEKKSRVKSM